MSDEKYANQPVDLAAANGLADANFKRESEKIRAAQAHAKHDAEQRKRQAERDDLDRREAEQAALKAEVQRYMLSVNTWMLPGDFETEWKNNKLRLVREYQSRLGATM